MSASNIQDAIYNGYNIAATVLGFPYRQYRPSAAANPTGGEPLATLSASFSTGAGYTYPKGGSYKDVVWNALVDGRQVEVGDYLVNDVHGTYFIAATQDLLPILAVKCNHTLTVYDPGPTKIFGADSNYGGTTAGTEVPIMTNWPGSLILDQRGRVTEVGLPTDLPSPFFQLLLPILDGADLRTTCFIVDDDGRRYTVSAAEKGLLGWRAMVQLAVT